MNTDVMLPEKTPLMCDVDKAVELFGVSRTTLYGLAKKYDNFPVKRIGRGIRFLVPDTYRWFRDFPGDIPTE